MPAYVEEYSNCASVIEAQINRQELAAHLAGNTSGTNTKTSNAPRTGHHTSDPKAHVAADNSSGGSMILIVVIVVVALAGHDPGVLGQPPSPRRLTAERRTTGGLRLIAGQIPGSLPERRRRRPMRRRRVSMVCAAAEPRPRSGSLLDRDLLQAAEHHGTVGLLPGDPDGAALGELLLDREVAALVGDLHRLQGLVAGTAALSGSRCPGFGRTGSGGISAGRSGPRGKRSATGALGAARATASGLELDLSRLLLRPTMRGGRPPQTVSLAPLEAEVVGMKSGTR